MGGRNWTRVDEGKKGWSLVAITMKACTVVGRGQKSLLSDAGSELHLRRAKEKEKSEHSRWDEQKQALTGKKDDI